MLIFAVEPYNGREGIQIKTFKKENVMRTQYITDDDGKKLAIILPIKEYYKMMGDLEELEEIKLYDVAKKGEQEFLAAEEAFKEIEKARKKNEDI